MPSLFLGGRRLLGLAVLPALVVTYLAAQPPKAKEADPAKPARTPWTTSRVVGSPDAPPPFKVVRAFPNLKFTHPLLITRPPSSDRLFVGEQAGVLYSFKDTPDAKAQTNFTDPELKIMKTNNKGWDYCGNAQVLVDDACQIILACDVTAASNDKEQAIPLAQAALTNLESAGIARDGFHGVVVVAEAVQAGAEDFPDQQAAPRLEGPDIA